MIKRSEEQKLRLYSRPEFYKKRIQELEMIEERVCWLLAKHEHTRDCDTCLIHQYWREVDQAIYSNHTDAEFLHKLTSADDIVRKRAHIQNTLGIWLPTTQEVILARKVSELAYNEWLSRRTKLCPTIQN